MSDKTRNVHSSSAPKGAMLRVRASRKANLVFDCPRDIVDKRLVHVRHELGRTVDDAIVQQQSERTRSCLIKQGLKLALLSRVAAVTQQKVPGQLHGGVVLPD